MAEPISDAALAELERDARAGRGQHEPTETFLALVAELRQARAPIPLLLFCPACGVQHVDTHDWARERAHRSHLCKPEDGGCGHVWRPADVATVGVAKLTTAGVADGSPVPTGLNQVERLLRAARVTKVILDLTHVVLFDTRDTPRPLAKAGSLARAMKKLEAENG